jgi:hypothetical protein
MSESEPKPSRVHEFQQEEERLDRRALVLLWVILLPFLVVLAFVAKELFDAASRTAEAQGVAQRPEPVAEVSSVRSSLFRRPAAGEVLNAEQRKTLRRFSWVDRQRGVVRVPIDVAIELVAKESR